MKCLRCGNPLPSTGYVCSHCGMMMSSGQIKEQKAFIKNDSNLLKTEFVSEKYGGKKQIFEGREKKEKSFLGILMVLVVFLLIVIVAIFVYF